MPKGIFYVDQRLANLVNFEVSLNQDFFNLVDARIP